MIVPKSMFLLIQRGSGAKSAPSCLVTDTDRQDGDGQAVDGTDVWSPLGALLDKISDAPTDGPGQSSFWFDMADAEAYEGLVEEVLHAIVSAAAASGLIDGHIRSETPDGDQLR